MVYRDRQMRSVLFTLILMSLLASPALAQDQDLQLARAWFVRAETHYRMGDFTKALNLYRSVYKLSSRPHLLFNVAQCYRQLVKRGREGGGLNNMEQAVFYYRLYLADWKRAFNGASPGNAAEVQRHIKTLSAAITRLKEKQRLRRQQEARRQEQERLRREQEQKKKKQETGRSRARRPWAWIAAGAGVVAVGAGVALLATRRVDELVWRPPSATDPGGTPYRITDSAASGAVLLGAGVVAGAVAAYLFIRREQPASTSVSVSPRGVWLSGSF